MKGLVGKCVVRELLQSPKFELVTSIARRELKTEGLPNLTKLSQKVVDFDKLDDCKITSFLSNRG